jgi:hypothetical protein
LRTQNFVPKKDFCSRRGFVTRIAAGAARVATLARSADGDSESAGTLRFGLIADVHQDIMHDSEERLRAFVERRKSERVDFILRFG